MPTISVANVELAEIAMKLANKTVKCTVKRACFVFRCSRGHRSGERMIFSRQKNSCACRRNSRGHHVVTRPNGLQPVNISRGVKRLPNKGLDGGAEGKIDLLDASSCKSMP